MLLRKRGSSIFLIVACIVFILLIGVGIDILLLTFKVNRVAMNTTDSVTLSVARDAAAYPKVDLRPGNEVEQLNGALERGAINVRSDRKNKVTLGNYNNLVSHTLVVAANAAALGNDESVNAANNLIDLVQGRSQTPLLTPTSQGTSSMSVGARLTAELNRACYDYSSGGFLELSRIPDSLFPVAHAIDRGRFGTPDDSGGNRYKKHVPGQLIEGKSPLIKDMVSWMGSDGPSNIEIKTGSWPYIYLSEPPQQLQPAVTAVSHNGKSYLPGYSEIKFSGGASDRIRGVYAVTYPDGEQPHLVSGTDFTRNISPPLLSSSSVPPNSFKYVAATLDKNKHKHLTVSQGQSGGLRLGREGAPGSQPWIPPRSLQVPVMEYAYIEIINMGDVAYFDDPGIGSPTGTVYSRELREGIWIANNGAFSTNKAVLEAWADFNNGRTATSPGVFDADGNLVVHGDTSTIRSLMRPSQGTRGSGPCMWIHVTPGDPDYRDMDCVDLLDEFSAAYPPESMQYGRPDSYMGVEKFKQYIRNAYPNCGWYGCFPHKSTGLRIYVDGWPGQAPDPPDGRPSREFSNPVPPGASSKISRAGTIRELLNQVDPDESVKVIRELKQRMKELEPDASDDAMNGILDNFRLDLGQIAYITSDYQGGLKIGPQKPLYLVGDVSNISDPKRMPVGLSRTIFSEYPTIGGLVNSPREQNTPAILFSSFPDPAVHGRAMDIAEWTIGIGIRNNLGRLRFKNQCGGTRPSGGAISDGGTFCQPD